MKKAVYITTTLLAAIVIVLILMNIVEYIDSAYDTFSPSFWYSFIIYIFEIMVILTFGVLSIIQLKKSTPRLMLLFSGYIFLSYINFAFRLRWWFALCVVAGLLSAVYEFVKHGKQIKKAPFHLEKYGRLLIAAGVLACIKIAYGIYSTIRNIPSYDDFFHGNPIFYYSSIAVGLVIGICIPVFCFIRNRRTGILYRMFFVGPSIINAVFLPVDIAFYFVLSASSDSFQSTLDPINIVLSLALVILILIHTFKTRHDSLIPQDIAIAAEQAEVPTV